MTYLVTLRNKDTNYEAKIKVSDEVGEFLVKNLVFGYEVVKVLKEDST